MQDFLFFRIDRSYLRLGLPDILYIQAEKKYVLIVTGSGSHQVLTSMNHIEKILPSQAFCRVHRSYIVALGQICKFDNELVYVGSRKIPLAEQYKSVLKKSVVILNNPHLIEQPEHDILRSSGRERE